MKSLLSVCLVVVCASTAWAQQAPTGAWSSAPLSGNGSITGDGYYYGGSATEGTYLYVVGGYHYGAGYTSGPLYYQRCRRFDPVNNTWADMANIPNGGSYYGGGTCFYTDGSNPYIYIFANYDPWYGYTGYTYRYSLALNSWSQLSNIPNNNYYSGAAALNNRIYIAGGGSNQTAFYEFNPADNSFTSRPNMPTGRYLLTCTSIPSLNRFYAIGGYGNNYMATMEAYEPPTQTYPNGRWLSGVAGNDPLEQDPQDMNLPNADGTPGSPATRYMAKAVTVGTRVYVVGGYSNVGGYTNTMLEFNPNASQTAVGGNQWRQRANMTGTRGYYPAAGVITTASGPKVVAYGGLSNSTTGEIFSPPDFGTNPNPPTALAQIGSSAASSLQAQADSTQTDGWTNNQIQFTGNLTDPDVVSNAPQQVRFRVQVKPASASWTSNQVTSLATSLGAQGVHTLSYNIPADGAFDWRWRVEDSYSNSYPPATGAWVEAFGTLAAPNTNSPDFRSDQLPPSDPIASSPHNVDTQVPDPVYGEVTLNWIESTDNGPVSGISYEIQVARDGGFSDIEAQLFSTAGTSSYPVTLTVSRYNKYWRIRAKDIGGNLSNWSAPLNFRVTYNDGFDHASGDAKKYCGMTATAVPGLGSAILGLVVFGLAALRRKLA